jgi:hypothetical protein
MFSNHKGCRGKALGSALRFALLQVRPRTSPSGQGLLSNELDPDRLYNRCPTLRRSWQQ